MRFRPVWGAKPSVSGRTLSAELHLEPATGEALESERMCRRLRTRNLVLDLPDGLAARPDGGDYVDVGEVSSFAVATKGMLEWRDLRLGIAPVTRPGDPLHTHAPIEGGTEVAVITCLDYCSGWATCGMRG